MLKLDTLVHANSSVQANYEHHQKEEQGSHGNHSTRVTGEFD